MIRTTNHFGAWLQTIMMDNGITVNKLAKTIGIDKRYCPHWIQGTAHPRLQNTIFLVISLEKLTEIDRIDLFEQLCQAVLSDS